jgi:hypothetical protein
MTRHRGIAHHLISAVLGRTRAGIICSTSDSQWRDRARPRWISSSSLSPLNRCNLKVR